MKKLLAVSAGLFAAGLIMLPQDASALKGGFGGGMRMGGFGGGMRMGGFGGGMRMGGFGGVRPAGIAWRGTGLGVRPAYGAGWGYRPWGWGYRRNYWGWGAGALAAGAVIGAAAASSYYPYDYYDYGWDYPCPQRLAWVWTPYGYQRAWVSTCY